MKARHEPAARRGPRRDRGTASGEASPGGEQDVGLQVVAVRSQRTGEHLATLPNVAHAREVVVDERHDFARASGFGDGTVDDPREQSVTRTVPAGAGALSVAAGPGTGRVLVANRTDADVTVVDPGEGSVVETLATDVGPNRVTVGDGTTHTGPRNARRGPSQGLTCEGPLRRRDDGTHTRDPSGPDCPRTGR